MIVSGTARFFVRVLSLKNIRAGNKSFQKNVSLDYFTIKWNCQESLLHELFVVLLVQALFVAGLLVLRWRY
jgi:hypothetical protein